jgi:signal transduction histidine kinase
MFRRNEVLAAQELQSRELIQLGEAARTLVHEIKNPLGIMRIQTARIRKGLGEDPKGQTTAATAIIDGEIRRLSDLADRIREFLKSSPARLETFDLMTFLEEFSARYANLESSGIEFSLELPTVQSAFAEADRDKLVIVLDNIVGNAIEAVMDMPEGERRVSLRLFEKDKMWTVAVIDSGRGIPPELQARIFTPFFTTKEKGSGIGLSLARRFAESFGGILELESHGTSKGAVFLLRVRPAASP